MLTFLRILLFPVALLRILFIWINTFLFVGAIIIEDKISLKTGKYKFWTYRNWGKTCLFILGIYVKRNKRPKAGSYILMANHSSYIDILMAASYSPSAFVAKAELANWPLIGTALKKGRAILVQRDQIQSLLETMKNIDKSIKSGTSVTVFPEGTTYKGEGTKAFKNGTFKIAAENQITILPCAIAYRNKEIRWTSKENIFAHFFKHFWKPFTIASIQFAQPFAGSDFKELKEKTQSTINVMLKEING